MAARALRSDDSSSCMLLGNSQILTISSVCLLQPHVLPVGEDQIGCLHTGDTIQNFKINEIGCLGDANPVSVPA
jgi:hypothetical protein